MVKIRAVIESKEIDGSEILGKKKIWTPSPGVTMSDIRSRFTTIMTPLLQLEDQYNVQQQQIQQQIEETSQQYKQLCNENSDPQEENKSGDTKEIIGDATKKLSEQDKGGKGKGGGIA